MLNWTFLLYRALARCSQGRSLQYLVGWPCSGTCTRWKIIIVISSVDSVSILPTFSAERGSEEISRGRRGGSRRDQVIYFKLFLIILTTWQKSWKIMPKILKLIHLCSQIVDMINHSSWRLQNVFWEKLKIMTFLGIAQMIGLFFSTCLLVDVCFFFYRKIADQLEQGLTDFGAKDYSELDLWYFLRIVNFHDVKSWMFCMRVVISMLIFNSIK